MEGPSGGLLSPVAIIPHIYLQWPLGNRKWTMKIEKSHIIVSLMHTYL